jgi:hypothetical protein
MALFDGSVLLGSQYAYGGRGPFDVKMLVKTYDELWTPETWLDTDGSSLAYNGMLVAVWKDSNKANNGIYFLYDGNKNNKNQDLINASNWHKLVSASDLENVLSKIDSRLTALEEKESDVLTFGYRSGFPATGEANKLYVAADEGKSYVWFNDAYLPVSGGGDYEEPEVIYGGDSGIK